MSSITLAEQATPATPSSGNAMIYPKSNGLFYTLDDTGSEVQLLPVYTPVTNSLSGDVALNNTANYFTGPTCAQGTSGVWFASGSVCLIDTTTANCAYHVKLWDGTTVISSAYVIASSVASAVVCVSLSGYISSPAGNIRISARDASSTNGAIKFNSSGNSKDSTLTVIRIG